LGSDDGRRLLDCSSGLVLSESTLLGNISDRLEGLSGALLHGGGHLASGEVDSTLSVGGDLKALLLNKGVESEGFSAVKVTRLLGPGSSCPLDVEGGELVNDSPLKMRGRHDIRVQDC